MFDRGTYVFNEDANFNFQLNRVVMWGHGDPEEIFTVSKSIRDSESWVRALMKLRKKRRKKAGHRHRSGTCGCLNSLCMIRIREN